MIDVATQENSGETTRRRRSWIQFAVAAFFIGLVIWAVWRLGPRRVLEVAQSADPTWLALSLVPLAGRFLIWGVKWDRILRRRAPVGYGVALRTLLAGAFVNLTTPTAKLGGGILRAVMLNRRFGWSGAASYGRALTDQVTTALGSFALFGVLAVIVTTTKPVVPLRGPMFVSGVVILAAIAVGLASRSRLWAWMQRPELERAAERRLPARLLRLDPDRPVGESIRDVFRPLLGEGHALTTIGSDLALGAVSFGSLCVANAFVFRALGVDVDMWLIATAVVMGYFAGTVLGTWGGVGVTEASLTVLYVRIGIPPETATAAALLHRTTFYLVVLVSGGLSWIIENRLVTHRTEP